MGAKMRVILLIITTILAIGCTELFQNRSFVDQMNHKTDGFFVPGEDFAIVAGDSGNPYRTDREIRERTPRSSYRNSQYQTDKSVEDELVRMENSLTDSQYSKYSRYMRYFNNTSEKIYYLNLSRGDREEYLRSRQISDQIVARNRHRQRYRYSDGNYRTPASEITSSIPIVQMRSFSTEAQSVMVGMDKVNVIKLWGNPMKIDIAGNPNSQNERWSFYTEGRKRVIYFENGKVEGWNIQ